MAAALSLEQIRDFWTSQAKLHKQSTDASWSDKPVIEMEIREIVSHIDDGDRVLDIGCANGYATMQFALARRIQITGQDYIPEMIAEANNRLKSNTLPLRGQVDFSVGDINAIEFADDTFDKVVVIRVVINLEGWERQIKSVRECARVLKPGGLLLLSEATLQGWRRLNAFRREWKLPDIPMPPFNAYLDQDRLVDEVANELEFVELVEFSSSYFVGTRILKPLLIQALGCDVNVADPNMEWNWWFSQLPPCGDYGTQKLFLFRKR